MTAYDIPVQGKRPMAHQLRYWSVTLLLFVALGMFFERPAHAYTDPGSTLLLFQSIGAVASGALFYFRRKIRTLFTRSSAGKPTTPPGIMSRADS